ncbi:hypothetical protein [Corynebacterium striatum]|uniref:hypothetical protein n=1 Tax=Corynebacterium striatum TaxID=43770 RepID=UPI003B5981F4
MTSSTTSSFKNLYPDVDPTRGLPLSVSERLALSLALAIAAYGAVTADMLIAGAGMAFTFIASVLQEHKTARRIRSEARTRFPSEDWAEHRATRRFNLGVLVPLWVGIIIALCAAGYWFVPPEYATPAAIVIAVLVALLAWFMPGISPLWRGKQTDPPAPEEDTDTAVMYFEKL